MSDLKTSGMKLSEIRPCDNCGGPITPMFYVVEVKHAVFNQQNVNAVLGTNQIFGGRSLTLAEVMAPGADEAVQVLENEEAVPRLFLCLNCAADDVNLLVICEAVERKKQKEKP